VLQRLASTPAVRYLYAYALPGDYRRLTNVADNIDMDPQLDDFDIVDRMLTTSSESVYLEYVGSDWSAAIWPAYFADCVSLKLAVLAAAKLTHDLGNKQLLDKALMQNALPYARSVDSQSQPARKTFIRSNWQKARFGGRQVFVKIPRS